jgi:hypothetical protein
MNYLILDNSLILNHEGNTTTIIKEDGRYEQVIKKIKEGKLDEIIPLLNIAKSLTDKGFDVKHGIVHVDGEALPDALSTRVLDFFNQGLPFEPLLKFWAKLKANPSFNSRQMLFKFLEHNGHPITTEGNFIAYRAVNGKFKDKRTGRMDNSVGAVVEVPRSQVDDNPNNTCSHGLHVATAEYATGFMSGGDKLIDVEVDPSDVVAVPTDYNGTKMRVSKFKVVAESNGLIKESLVDSSYQPRDDFDTQDHYDEEGEEYCPNCGTEVSPDVTYCGGCGLRL